MKINKKIIIGIAVFVCFVAVGVLAVNFLNKDDGSGGIGNKKLQTVYGAVGGGKENFLSDPKALEIFAKYGIQPVHDPWSNGKLITNPLEYEANGKTANYDFVFFSDIRFYEYYKTAAKDGEAARLPVQKSEIVLNTPIVIYSWDKVCDALVKEGIVTQIDGTYFISDMPKLLTLINEEKKWSDIGLSEIYGKINIISTDPVTSSPGATYYGLLAAIMNDGAAVDQNMPTQVLDQLSAFYKLSGFLNNTPADLFDQYLRTGMGAKPMIVDYEKSIIDFANQNPSGFDQVKDRIRVLYPMPTVWNSHCIMSFTEAGSQYIQALNDPEMQQLAWESYGFRTGLAGGSYDTSTSVVSGIPQDINAVVSGLKMDAYNVILNALKEGGN